MLRRGLTRTLVHQRPQPRAPPRASTKRETCVASSRRAGQCTEPRWASVLRHGLMRPPWHRTVPGWAPVLRHGLMRPPRHQAPCLRAPRVPSERWAALRASRRLAARSTGPRRASVLRHGLMRPPRCSVAVATMLLRQVSNVGSSPERAAQVAERLALRRARRRQRPTLSRRRRATIRASALRAALRTVMHLRSVVSQASWRPMRRSARQPSRAGTLRALAVWCGTSRPLWDATRHVWRGSRQGESTMAKVCIHAPWRRRVRRRRRAAAATPCTQPSPAPPQRRSELLPRRCLGQAGPSASTPLRRTPGCAGHPQE